MGRNENTDAQCLSQTPGANPALGDKWPGRVWTPIKAPIPVLRRTLIPSLWGTETRRTRGQPLSLTWAVLSALLTLPEDDSASWGDMRVKGENACQVPSRARGMSKPPRASAASNIVKWEKKQALGFE